MLICTAFFKEGLSKPLDNDSNPPSQWILCTWKVIENKVSPTLQHRAVVSEHQAGVHIFFSSRKTCLAYFLYVETLRLVCLQNPREWWTASWKNCKAMFQIRKHNYECLLSWPMRTFKKSSHRNGSSVSILHFPPLKIGLFNFALLFILYHEFMINEHRQ